MSRASEWVQSEWQRALTEAEQRSQAIELRRAADQDAAEQVAQAPPTATGGTAARPWRVRLYKADPDALLVQRPGLAPGDRPLRPGDTLLGLLVAPRGRWSFRCRVLGPAAFEANGRSLDAMRVTRPDEAHNAQRRDYFRVETAAMPLPPIRLWRLIDPASAVDPERHNALVHRSGRRAGRRNAWGEPAQPTEPPAMPRLGEGFEARILDISGGGMRITLPLSAEPMLENLPNLWIEAALPEAPAPLYLTARIAHYHPEPPDRLCVGLTYCFEHHPPHERFVVDQMCRFTTYLERQQLQREALRKAEA